MDLEQLPPNKPNFSMVVILFAVVIIVILIAGVLFFRADGKHLPSGLHRPTSQLLLRDMGKRLG